MTKVICELGGAGVVSVASHLAGPQVRRLVQAARSGNQAEAGKLHDALMPLFDSLFVEPSPMPVKGALSATWGNVGDPRLPLVAASAETVQLVEQSLEAAEAL